MAIKVYPMYGESWKRRGQARGALGQNEDAIADLQKALELSPDHHSKAECLTEQGMLYHKLKDFRQIFAGRRSFHSASSVQESGGGFGEIGGTQQQIGTGHEHARPVSHLAWGHRRRIGSL